MIEVLPRSEDERALWQATLDLAELLAGLPWTLVGAQMVMLHAFEAGAVPGRTTIDLDLLFDVRAFVGATDEATRRLQSAGFASAGREPDGVAHRFVRSLRAFGRASDAGWRVGRSSSIAAMPPGARRDGRRTPTSPSGS